MRARRRRDGLPALLKIPRPSLPPRETQQELEREWGLLARLDLSGVARPLELSTAAEPFLAVIDPGGIPLRSLVGDGPLPLERFLAVAQSLAALLDALHRRRSTFQPMHPDAFVVDRRSGTVILVDVATCADEGTDPTLGATTRATHLLSYVSPEQTGRMNRTVDERSDLYSLGILYYELLVGHPPCTSSDPLELVHWHIARRPPAPGESAPHVPEVLDRIVLRLLAKTADERYQSAGGLLFDLRRCAEDLARSGSVGLFEIGSRDLPPRLLSPRRLYGREGPLSTLEASFDAARDGASSLLLVAGYSGIGKTALVHELCRSLVRQRGHFVAGKFDQIVRDIPFGALIQAFRGLIQQLLTLDEAALSGWRDRLSRALGANGGVLTDVIPELALVLGPQPPAPPLHPTESQNRFRLVFHDFVATLASPEHPLVVFLDDLQWADPATLGTFELLLTSSEVRSLLLVGAYRDNEVGPDHPLSHALERLERVGAPPITVALGPLETGDVEGMVRDCLARSPTERDAEVAALARLVHQKTGGNPFFVIQFLRSLRQEGMLGQDSDAGRWRFDLAEISAASFTDNVVDLMSRKIARLPEASRTILSVAAAIGNEFSLASLSVVLEMPESELLAGLEPPRREGLILAVHPPTGPEDGAARRRSESAAETLGVGVAPAVGGGRPGNGAREGQAPPTFRFLHDRVQQAAYSLIREEDRPTLHLRVGRLLREHLGESEESIFDLVHHLNLGRCLIESTDEALSLARLDLQAARRAKTATAYAAACHYLAVARELAARAVWTEEYELLFALHLESAECLTLSGDFSGAEESFSILLAHARSTLDAAQVYALRILHRENLSRYAEATELGREILPRFGLPCPSDEAEQRRALERELAAIDGLRGSRQIAALIDLPVITDAEVRMVLRLLTALWAPAYVAGEITFTKLLSAIMVRLSLEHGNVEESAYGYVTHAITVGSDLGDFSTGLELGKLAIAVNERLRDPRHRAKVHHMYSCFVAPWRLPLSSCIPHAEEAVRAGLESGDFAYTNYGAFHQSWYGFFTSSSLDEFTEAYSDNVPLLVKLKMTSFAEAQKVILQWAAALAGRTASPIHLDGEDFAEAAYLAAHARDPFFMTFFLVAKLHLALTFGGDDALELADRAGQVVHALGGTIWPPTLATLRGLALADHAHAGPEDRAAHVAELDSILEVLAPLAESAPSNFRPGRLLVAAERAALVGDWSHALSSFEEAVDEARRCGACWLEALALERTARAWQRRGDGEVAGVLYGRAADAYGRWGARAKARSVSPVALPTPARGEGDIDLATVERAARALASEIDLDALLRRLLCLAIENAGAERGVLVRPLDGRLVVEAEGRVDGEGVHVPHSLPLESAQVPLSVIQYVRNTSGALVLGSAAADERFADDPVIRRHAPLSIFCLPLLQRGELAGILYLENSLVSDAFTTEREGVLHLLVSHAAVALSNARLYAEMRQEVERRRRAEEELRSALQEVETLKNRLEAENVYLQEEIRRVTNFDELVGSSPALLRLLEQIRLVAPTDATVLVHGETGTGKELVARAIHSMSGRSERPLVTVNCAAVSAGLVESELFGHVKGAFTGAVERRVGRFELADRGTLFLDEIGELPPETQVKLLRVLQERELEPVGSSRTVKVDVRIIAATNRDLEQAVREGRFRSDLYYRLNVFPVAVPPLRDRLSDIDELVAFFLSRFSQTLGRRFDALTPGSHERLHRYDWPGNVRELRNVLERAAVVGRGPLLDIGPELLATRDPEPRLVQRDTPPRPGDAERFATLADSERRHILEALERTGGVVAGPHGAATLLDLHPNTLRSRMKKLGIAKRSA